MGRDDLEVVVGGPFGSLVGRLVDLVGIPAVDFAVDLWPVVGLRLNTVVGVAVVMFEVDIGFELPDQEQAPNSESR